MSDKGAEHRDCQTLDYALDGGVAEITMNRPDNANALNARMAAALFDGARRAESERARAIIVTGSGRAT